MKITSHYRGKETELCNVSTRMKENKDGELTIKANRHYSGNEKFYEVELEKHELWLIKQSLIEPKSKLVLLAERIDNLIDHIKNYKRR